MIIVIHTRKKKNGKALGLPINIEFHNGDIDETILCAATGLIYLRDNEYYSVERDGMLYFDKFKDGREDWKCKLSKKFDKDKEVYQDVFLAMKKIGEDANKFDFPCAFEEPHIGKSDSCDSHQKSEDKKDKEFTSRFMPNVKFTIKSVNDTHIHDVYNLLSWAKVPYKKLGFHQWYFQTSECGEKLFLGSFFQYTNFNNDNKREVSIYEAIPELVPDGMIYDKESDSLIPFDENGIAKATQERKTKNHVIHDEITYFKNDFSRDQYFKKSLNQNDINLNELAYQKGEINIKQYTDQKIELEFKKRGL